MSHYILTDEQIRQFEEDGYVTLRGLVDIADVETILQIAGDDPQLAADTKANNNFEGEGLGTVLAYRPYLSDNIYSAIARSKRVVEPMEQLLDGEIFHYYHLITQKNPNTGGWQYHQDYGYHYKQFLYPAYASCMLALHPATRQNGCLKVIKRSIHLGRIDHQSSGSQLISDPERTALVSDHLEEVHCELDPGDVLYFHSNTLHASDPNLSPNPRWAMILSYTAATNVSTMPEDANSQYEFLEKLDDEQVREIGRCQWEALQAQTAGAT